MTGDDRCSGLGQVAAAARVVALVVATAACTAPGAPSADSSAAAPVPSAIASSSDGGRAGPIAFSSDRYGYAVELPPGWYVREEGPGAWTIHELGYVGPGTDSFELDYPDRGEVPDFPGITYGMYVSSAPNTDNLSLAEWTDTIARTTDRESSCHGKPDREEATVDGEPAALLVYDRIDCEHDHHVLIVGVLHGDRGYVILWLAPTGESDVRRSQFEAVLDTFDFTE